MGGKACVLLSFRARALASSKNHRNFVLGWGGRKNCESGFRMRERKRKKPFFFNVVDLLLLSRESRYTHRHMGNSNNNLEVCARVVIEAT